MQTLIWILIALSALCFVLAVYSSLWGIVAGFLGVQTEGISRACTNLALLAIALSLATKKKGSNS